MITKHERHISYICPACHTVTTRIITPFVFSGRKSISIRCTNNSCETPCINIHDKNGAYTIEAACLLCGAAHSETINKKHFWHDELTKINCDESGIDIMFVGDYDKIKDAWVKFEKDCDALEGLSESFFEDFEPDTDDEELADRLYTALDILSILTEIGAVQCKCGNHSVGFTVIDNKIGFRCSKCGSIKINDPTDDFIEALSCAEDYVFNS